MQFLTIPVGTILKLTRNYKTLLPTMYIKNKRNSSKFNAFGSYQTLYLTESFVLCNRLLFIIKDHNKQ